MTPKEFTFKLTVPNDPEGASVVGVVAAHAVEYAQIDAAAGDAFVQQARATAAQALEGASGHCSHVTFAAADGQLTVTVGGQSVSAPLPS